MTTLVVCRDSDVDEFGRGVRVAEGDDGNIDVRGFFYGLGVGAWVGEDDEAGLFEGTSNVVGEITGGKATGDGDGSGVCGEFEDSALTVGTSGDDTYVGGVVDGGDYAGCEDDFLPVGRT